MASPDIGSRCSAGGQKTSPASRRAGARGSQQNQGREQNEHSGHAVNLTENRDGRQGAAGVAATPVQATRCWRGRAILEAAWAFNGSRTCSAAFLYNFTASA